MAQKSEKGEPHYDHAAICTDGLLVASKSPKLISDSSIDKCRFKLKCTGPISHYLCCEFICGRNDESCQDPRECIEKMKYSHTYAIDSKPKSTHRSPMKKGDHAELETSDFLDADDVQQHQSLIGSLKWTVSL